MDIPLGFVVLYLTQNVRLTKGFLDISATVTAGRNQLGKFSDEFLYISDLFYYYVRMLSFFGPKQLAFNYPDIFLHLHQNLTHEVVTQHSSCVVSMPFLLQYYKNVHQINSFMSRCIAANHIMTRRYPSYWSSYYIQLGLAEYYTIYMQLKGIGKSHHSMAMAESSVSAFYIDDHDHGVAIMGAYYTNQDYYYRINAARGEIYSLQRGFTVKYNFLNLF